MVCANVQERTNAGRQVSRATIFCRVTPKLWVSYMELASFLASGGDNFEFASTFLKNSFTLACASRLIQNSQHGLYFVVSAELCLCTANP
jgi:hypothetical protein